MKRGGLFRTELAVGGVTCPENLLNICPNLGKYSPAILLKRSQLKLIGLPKAEAVHQGSWSAILVRDVCGFDDRCRPTADMWALPAQR